MTKFTAREIELMHRWCLKYRALVRSGGKPTPEQDRKFRRYSNQTYAAGVAHEHART